jgi:hypothetical protein
MTLLVDVPPARFPLFPIISTQSIETRINPKKWKGLFPNKLFCAGALQTIDVGETLSSCSCGN